MKAPQGWQVVTKSADAFALEQCYPDVRDEDGDLAFFVSGTVLKSVLRFGIRTRYQGQLATQRGDFLFQLMVQHFDDERTAISTLQGNWRVGDFGSNLISFNRAVASNLSREIAALKYTFTGKMAERVLHFTTVTFEAGFPIPANAPFVEVVVNFSK